MTGVQTCALPICVLTGGAWIFYFADAPDLLQNVVTLQAPLVAYSTIALLTATTYIFGGLMREQVCTYMCPWPRIQGAMLDAETVIRRAATSTSTQMPVVSGTSTSPRTPSITSRLPAAPPSTRTTSLVSRPRSVTSTTGRSGRSSTASWPATGETQRFRDVTPRRVYRVVEGEPSLQELTVPTFRFETAREIAHP